MTLNDWGNQLVRQGVPFLPKGRSREGLDCWGLVWLAYKEVYGICLPSYSEIYESSDLNGSQNLKKVGGWIEEKANEWIEVDRVNPGDCILLKLYGRPIHVGLVIDPRSGEMLHIEKGIDACYESYKTSIWKSRVYGFFRCKSRCGDAPV